MVRAQQGSAILKLTPTNLRDFDLSFPELTIQKLVGRIYFSMLHREALINKKAATEKTMVIETIGHLINE
jgi:hypothetical protein